ncbi:MAG TPA: winged helix-turn-helix domain-containing protein [Thermoanaerobaculia bacterium]
MPVRFGCFILDSDRRQLLRDDQEVHLSPKAFRLLELLVEREPAAVSKQQLYDAVWPSTFVEESNLACLVKELRAALEDDRRNPRFVRTAYGFGYAFCGGAEPLGPEAAIPARQLMAALVWDTRVIPLHEGASILGRGADADIPIEDTTVSRHHARIDLTGRAAVLRDLESKNGTFVAGRRITGATELEDGDAIALGSVHLVYRQSPAGLTTTSMGESEGRGLASMQSVSQRRR